MKNLTHLFVSCMMVCAAALLFSCKKERMADAELQSSTSAQQATGSECRPVVFGSYDTYGWRTIAQKWYVNGRVKYLKAKFGGSAAVGMNPWLEGFDLVWGEVSYEGNQVYLRDVLNDKLLMRVTLNSQHQPVASYYYIMGRPDNYLNDTTYYYYHSDGRLDYMISVFELAFFSPTTIFQYRKYVFSYDSYGNVVKAEFPSNSRLNIQYDYTKPAKGLINNFQLTSSLKLLEYLELIELPMHHAVMRTNFETVSYPNSPYEYYSEVFHSEYNDYVISDGLVRSYVYEPVNSNVMLYNGWECGTDPLNINNGPGNAIANLQEFQHLYSQKHINH